MIAEASYAGVDNRKTECLLLLDGNHLKLLHRKKQHRHGRDCQLFLLGIVIAGALSKDRQAETYGWEC